ncbi:MAG: FAD-dependent monooxygenase [Blastocatellia bacterium]
MTKTQVLIVGGSLNGLTMALLLAHRGVKCVVVERHPATTVQYKFRGMSPRSMEIFRGLGIEDEIRTHRTGSQKEGQIVRMKNLSDPEIHWEGIPWTDTEKISPTTAETIDQDRLEPILRSHAERLGADIRFNTEFEDFEQDERSIRACVRNLETEQEDIINAEYLIAADGTGGTTREKLEIERHGAGTLQHWMNIIFDTDLSPELEGRKVTSFFLTDINGTFVPRGGGRWLMAIQYVPEKGERAEDFTDEHCRELIFKGAGRTDVKADIYDARSWEVAALIADKFQKGRAFIIGDAAHTMPPTGGFGGNTGIHDAHNLAWKLAAVLRGDAGLKLLDSYDAERRPVAQRTLAQALARLQAWFKDPSKHLPPAEKITGDFDVIFGYLYHSDAIIEDEGFSRDDAFENPETPSGRPGSRAAHIFLKRGDEKISTIDLFNNQWTLLAGKDGGEWKKAADSINDLQSYQIGSDLQDIENRWSSAYGVDADGAILVRPDGFIAWRSHNAVEKPGAVLREVFERLNFRAQAQKSSVSRS